MKISFKITTLNGKKFILFLELSPLIHRLRNFQYKLINNILYLNKMLFRFNLVTESSCSFCSFEDETPIHIFHDCIHTQNLWSELQIFLSDSLTVPSLTPQSAIFGFIDIENQNYIIINHLHLIFKYNIYKSRTYKSLNFLYLKSDIKKVINTEETISLKDQRKKERFFKKWEKIINLVS